MSRYRKHQEGIAWTKYNENKNKGGDGCGCSIVSFIIVVGFLVFIIANLH